MTTETTQQDQEQAQADEAQARDLKSRIRRLCAVASSRPEVGVMDTDNVRGSQMEAYEEFLNSEDEDSPGAKARAILSEHDGEDLRKFVNARGGFPREESNELRGLMEQAGLTSSHVWTKGLAAAYIALQVEGSGELPADPDPDPEPEPESSDDGDGDEAEAADNNEG